MACNVTAGSGQSKSLDNALGTRVKGTLQGIAAKLIRTIQQIM
jgi:hypothetical protein